MKFIVLRVVLMLLCIDSSPTNSYAQEEKLGEPFIAGLRFRVANSKAGWDNMLDEIPPTLMKEPELNKRVLIAKQMVEKNFPDWYAFGEKKEGWVFSLPCKVTPEEDKINFSPLPRSRFYLAFRTEVPEGETKDALNTPLVFLQRKLDKNCYWKISDDPVRKNYKMSFQVAATVGEFKGWYLIKGEPREKLNNQPVWDVTLTPQKPMFHNVIDGVDGP